MDNPADTKNMVFTWFFLFMAALVCGITASLVLLYARRISTSLRYHHVVIGTVKRRQGLRAIIEWQSVGETYIVAPLDLFAIRKKQEVALLIDPMYITKATINHWTSNGKIYRYAGYLFGSLSLLFSILTVSALFTA